MASVSSPKFYVGNLSWHTDDNSLKLYFQENTDFKEDELSVQVIRDRDTGRSRGFGFVTILAQVAEDFDAAKVIESTTGQELDGRMIRVDKASERSSGPREGGYRPRDSYSGDGEYGRSSGGRREGGYRPRRQDSGYADNDGGYRPRRQDSGYADNDGGYRPRRQDSGYAENDGGYDGGHNNQPTGDEGGYAASNRSNINDNWR